MVMLILPDATQCIFMGARVVMICDAHATFPKPWVPKGLQHYYLACPQANNAAASLGSKLNW
jgi:hypothetical protein